MLKSAGFCHCDRTRRNPNDQSCSSALIALIGLPGSGKSTVGRQLARRLRLSFTDSDQVIEQRLGCPIRVYFEREGEARFRADFPGWEPLAPAELIAEMEVLLSNLALQRTVFRSDHASNWLVLKGTLGADKERLLTQVRAALVDPRAAGLRPAWARGL